MIKLPMTNEIVSCLISSGLKPQAIKTMRSNPKDFLQQILKSELSEDLQVQMVENTKEHIHLGLPYYRQVDELKRLRTSYFWRVVNRLKNLFVIMKANSHA